MEKSPHLPSDVTLREHFETLLKERDTRYQQRFDAQSAAIAAAFAAAKEAVIKAEVASEKRFECVEAETPVLCADLVWRPAGSLKVGDELIAFDEEALPGTGRRGRRLLRAVVTANSIETDELLEVVTPRGTVRCNPQHPWLTRPQDKRVDWKWVRADELRYGDAVHHVFAKAAIAWERKPLGGWHRATLVTAVNKVKKGKIAALSTSSRTYIAAGFAMHNSVNEFRGQLNDMISTLIPRGEAAARFESITGKIELLRERLDKSEGSGSGLKLGWSLLSGAIVLAATIVGMFFALGGR